MSETATPPDHLPAENGVHVWRAAIIMPPITAIFVGLRFYSRLYVLRRKLTADDYVVAVTMCLLIAHGVLMALATYHGMGLHIWQYTPELNADYYLWLGISSMFYTASLVGFKTALLLLYLQVFGANKKFRYACWVVMIFTWGYLTPALLTEFFGCSPIEKKWHPELPGHCINDVPAKIFYGAGHVITDLVIGILPLTRIWKLQQTPAVQKIGLSLVLSSGFMDNSAMAFGIARWAISTYNMVSYDRPWWAGISFTLSILEPNMGLICACVATFSPLVQLSYDRTRQWTSRRDRNLSEKASSRHFESGQGTSMTVGEDETVVFSASAFPTDTALEPFDLHGLQALEYNRIRQNNNDIEHGQVWRGGAGSLSREARGSEAWESISLEHHGSLNMAKYHSMISTTRKPVGPSSQDPPTNTPEDNFGNEAYYPPGPSTNVQFRDRGAYTTSYPEATDSHAQDTVNPIFYTEPAHASCTTGVLHETSSPQALNPTYAVNHTQGMSYPQPTYYPEHFEWTDYTPETTYEHGGRNVGRERRSQQMTWANFSHPLPLRRDRS